MIHKQHYNPDKYRRKCVKKCKRLQPQFTQCGNGMLCHPLMLSVRDEKCRSTLAQSVDNDDDEWKTATDDARITNSSRITANNASFNSLACYLILYL